MSSNDGYVLILKDKSSGKWSFPKGAKEDSDGTPLKTAIRECSEETGLLIDRDYYLLSYAPLVTFNRMYFYANIITGAEERIILQDSEIVDYRWMNPHTSCPYWRDLNIGIREYMRTVKYRQVSLYWPRATAQYCDTAQYHTSTQVEALS